MKVDVTSLVEESVLVCEVERYRLDTVGLTSTHSLGSEPNSSRGAGLSSTLEMPRLRGARLGLMAPQLRACTSGFSTVDERKATLHLRVREQAVTVVTLKQFGEPSLS